MNQIICKGSFVISVIAVLAFPLSIYSAPEKKDSDDPRISEIEKKMEKTAFQLDHKLKFLERNIENEIRHFKEINQKNIEVESVKTDVKLNSLQMSIDTTINHFKEVSTKSNFWLMAFIGTIIGIASILFTFHAKSIRRKYVKFKEKINILQTEAINFFEKQRTFFEEYIQEKKKEVQNIRDEFEQEVEIKKETVEFIRNQMEEELKEEIHGVAKSKEHKEEYTKDVCGRYMEPDVELSKTIALLEKKERWKNIADFNFLKAINAIQMADYNSAIDHLTKPITDPKVKKMAIFFKAIAFSRIGEYEKAIKLFDKALKEDKLPQLYCGRGYAKFKLDANNYKQAADDFKRAIDYKKDYFLAHMDLVECYLIGNAPTQALKHLENKALKDLREIEHDVVLLFFRFVAVVMVEQLGSQNQRQNLKLNSKECESDFLSKLNKMQHNGKVWPFIQFEDWIESTELKKETIAKIINYKMLLQSTRSMIIKPFP